MLSGGQKDRFKSRGLFQFKIDWCHFDALGTRSGNYGKFHGLNSNNVSISDRSNLRLPNLTRFEVRPCMALRVSTINGDELLMSS